jgi:hypothetical protein
MISPESVDRSAALFTLGELGARSADGRIPNPPSRKKIFSGQAPECLEYFLADVVETM